MVIFPEGALCTEGYMTPFKPGAFNALKGVQFFRIKYYKDWMTGITPSPAKTIPVMFMCNFARA